MMITEFLLARIAEDEELANASIATQAPDGWENPTPGANYYPADIAFWDRLTPTRALAECAAKRAIIKQAELASADRDAIIVDYYSKRTDVDEGHATDPGKLILRALASVYSDHPDYQQEWEGEE